MADKCMSCKRGLHKLCEGCDCSHEVVEETVGTKKRTARRKPDHALKDQQSTGRKRAAREYPVICLECNQVINLRDKKCGGCDEPTFPPCEWRDKADCGGGQHPILGCTDGLATDRHHGPDKRTTNNDAGNVHRICAWCHHGWHGVNNPDYDWSKTSHGTHNPRPMTEEERVYAIMRDAERKERTLKKVRD